MFIEEACELILLLNKAYRGMPYPDAITEELADVQVMLDQLKRYYADPDYYEAIRQFKLDRLRDRIGEIAHEPEYESQDQESQDPD